MTEPNPPSVRNTSLPLIILTLAVGIALGWLLRDQLIQPVALVPTLYTTEVPTLVLVASAAPTGVPPTSAPTVLPTVTALPTQVLRQTSVPEPTATPKPTSAP